MTFITPLGVPNVGGGSLEDVKVLIVESTRDASRVVTGKTSVTLTGRSVCTMKTYMNQELSAAYLDRLSVDQTVPGSSIHTTKFQGPLEEKEKKINASFTHEPHDGDSQTLQHLDDVESDHTTLGVASFNSCIVVPRVIWISVHVVVVRSAAKSDRTRRSE